MRRRTLILAGLAASLATSAEAEDEVTVRFRDALERIALLDEDDGHSLSVKHAFRAVGIASQTLGKHPAEIFLDREARLKGK